MAAPGPATVQDERSAAEDWCDGEELSPIADKPETLEQRMMSFETLDRVSPNIFVERIPGASRYMSLCSADYAAKDLWNDRLQPEDVHLMHQLGALTTSSMVIEVKKLHDLVYKLGIEECKEMTRGKYLDIFHVRCQR